jgi:hypothetical protein
VIDLGQFIDDCRQIAQECTRDRSSRAVSDPTATPTCCGIQLGSSWPIRVWILGRCNTISATRASSIRFDIANFLPSGSAISGRTRGRLADTRWPSFRSVTKSSATFAERRPQRQHTAQPDGVVDVTGVQLWFTDGKCPSLHPKIPIVAFFTSSTPFVTQPDCEIPLVLN